MLNNSKISMRLSIIFSLLVLSSGKGWAQENLLDILAISGELTQGSAVIGKLPFNEQGFSGVIRLNDKAIKITPDGQFFIGFGRDEPLEQVLIVFKTDGSSLSQRFKLTEREYRLQKVNGVPQKTVTPSVEHQARIKAENLLVQQARAEVSELHYFLEPFIAPMNSPITGVYGSQRIYNGVPKWPHYGVDYAGPVGAPVYAPASGLVTLTHEDMFYSGGTLIIDHGYGVSSSFLHLSEILVEVGQRVMQGQLIAKVGKGGRATGPHLDWRMNWFDVRIDPLKVLKISK